MFVLTDTSYYHSLIAYHGNEELSGETTLCALGICINGKHPPVTYRLIGSQSLRGRGGEGVEAGRGPSHLFNSLKIKDYLTKGDK